MRAIYDWEKTIQIWSCRFDPKNFNVKNAFRSGGPVLYKVIAAAEQERLVNSRDIAEDV